MASSIRSPPIGNDGQGTSRIASFIPKSLSSSANSISRNTAKASDYIFNALSPSPGSASSSSPASASPSWFSNASSPPMSPGSASGDDTGSGPDSDSPSFFSYFIRFILVAALLAFAGFNIFAQLGIATDEIVKFTEPVVRPVMNLLGMITKQTVSTTVAGTKTGIDIVSGATKSGVNVIEDQITGSSSIQSSGNGDARQERARATALTMKTGVDAADTAHPEADDASSVTQKGKISGKAGFCLVGEDRGIRSCMKVGEGDTCMSGNIFPSKDVCINPSLRV